MVRQSTSSHGVDLILEEESSAGTRRVTDAYYVSPIESMMLVSWIQFLKYDIVFF